MTDSSVRCRLLTSRRIRPQDADVRIGIHKDADVHEVAQARIGKGLVFVNNAPCLKAEHQISEGDRLTVRGVGRARIESFGGTSRKGRIFLGFVKNA